MRSLVEGQYLGWQDSETVYRGDRDEVEELVRADLEHMRTGPGFVHFQIEDVMPQNAAEVLWFMNEHSRAGYLVAVPVRVWNTGRQYVVSGIDPTWKS